MPTLLRWKNYRFFFYSADGWEPPHVHVASGGREAKIWLHDLAVAANVGYSAREIGEIVRKTRDERDAFLRTWHDYFANRG
jgi:hypothetical protein